MFANSNLGVSNTSFPDVTRTPSPGGPVPVPYPNIDLSTSHVPAVMNAQVGGGILGGFDPMAWLSMLGGGEPAAAAGAPASVPGVSITPSQTNVMLLG